MRRVDTSIKTAEMVPSDDSPATAARRKAVWWRFTLRELFLVLLAIGAIVALVVRSGPLVPTPFFESFRGGDTVEAVCRQLGVDPGLMEVELLPLVYRHHAVRGWKLGALTHYPSPGVTLERVITALESEVDSQLRAAGCRITSSSSAGDPAKGDVSFFSRDYERGAVAGDVQVHSFDRTKEGGTLFIEIHEYPR